MALGIVELSVRRCWNRHYFLSSMRKNGWGQKRTQKRNRAEFRKVGEDFCSFKPWQVLEVLAFCSLDSRTPIPPVALIKGRLLSDAAKLEAFHYRWR